MDFERNAIISSATISLENGVLTSWLMLDYGASGQGFGGYALYLPKSYKHFQMNTVAGHFIFRAMQIAGVEKWSDMVGKTVRVRGNDNKVEALGHIVHDDWFYPEEDFKTP